MARRLRREEIEIPSSVAGKVIGKGGANIKAMENSPHILSVRVDPSPSYSSTSTVVILGFSEEAIDAVASRVRNLALLRPRRLFIAITYKPDFHITLASYKTGVTLKRAEKRQYTASLKEFNGRELPQILANIEMLRGHNPDASSAFRFFLPHYHYASPEETPLEEPCQGGGVVHPPLCDDGNKFFMAVYEDEDDKGDGRQAYEACLRKSLSELSSDLSPSFTVRFGKSVYTEKPSLVSVPFKPSPGNSYGMDELCKVLERKLKAMFSSGCGEHLVERLRNALLEDGYEKLATKQKIEVHVADEEKRVSYKLSMRPDTGKDSSSVNAATEVARILKSTDYFQVLDVPINAPTSTIKKAYRRIVLLVHPNNNRELEAEIATKVVNEAYETITNENKRQSHIHSLPCHVPICNAISKEEQNKMKPRPEVISFRSKKRRLGFVTFTGDWQDMGFRMRVQGRSEHDGIQDQEMLQWANQAWIQRTSSNILVFDSRRTFKTSTMYYKETHTFISDNFCLKIAKLTSADSQNTTDPPKLEVSLQSWKIKELIGDVDQQWRAIVTEDHHHSLLENCVHDLIEEATRLCLVMGSIF